MIFLNLQSNQDTFFLLLFCSIYKIVNSEYCKGNRKSSKINTGAAMKNVEILKLFSDQLKTKAMFNYAVKEYFRNKICP